MAEQDAHPAPPEPKPQREEKLPYRRPTLAHLGSVRELTLGAAGSAGEVAGMMAM